MLRYRRRKDSTDYQVALNMKPQIQHSSSSSMGLRKCAHSLLLSLIMLFLFWHTRQFLEVVHKFNLKSQDANRTEWEQDTRSRSNRTPPIIDHGDLIMRNREWMSAIVITEFKLIFFPIPKVASSAWKIIFRKMMEREDFKNQKKKNEGLRRLRTFTLHEVQEIMTSSEWTRAVFVREPKERILSAFLNKFVEGKSYFKKKCCNESSMPKKLDREECEKGQQTADFQYFLHISRSCPDPHWYPQRNIIDEKWWPYITFIGYLQNAESDAKSLLQSVKSSKDNHTAWKKYGSTGWGENGTDSFMSSNSLGNHRTDARQMLTKYYSRCDEVFVEKYSIRDWESPYFHFDNIELYERSGSTSVNLFQCGLL